MRTYSVRVSREGKWWVARATDFDNAVTQARRLAEVDEMARDMISLLEDVDPAEVAVDVTVEHIGDVDVAELVHAVEDTRASMERAQAAYSERLRREAGRLSHHGLTVRDIGAILSVSHQRAQQLLDDRSRPTATS